MADCTYPSPLVVTARKLYLDAQMQSATTESERKQIKADIREAWDMLTGEALKLYQKQAEQIQEQAALANWLESIDLGGWPTKGEIETQMQADEFKRQAAVILRDAQEAEKSIKTEAPKAEIKIVEKPAKHESVQQCTIVSKPAQPVKGLEQLYVPSFDAMRRELGRRVRSNDLAKFAKPRRELPRNEKWFRIESAKSILLKDEAKIRDQQREELAKLRRNLPRAGCQKSLRSNGYR